MKWISVKKSFPPEGQYVLVCDGNLNLDNEPFYEIAAYRTFQNGSFFIAGAYILHDIKFWMHLPEPPDLFVEDEENIDEKKITYCKRRKMLECNETWMTNIN
jgi:hypothetical protein